VLSKGLEIDNLRFDMEIQREIEVKVLQLDGLEEDFQTIIEMFTDYLPEIKHLIEK
jgi:hypothetical protein